MKTKLTSLLAALAFSLPAHAGTIYAYSEHMAGIKHYSQELQTFYPDPIYKGKYGIVKLGLGIYRGHKLVKKTYKLRRVNFQTGQIYTAKISKWQVGKTVKYPSASFFYKKTVNLLNNTSIQAGIRAWIRIPVYELYLYPFLSLPVIKWGKLTLKTEAGRGIVYAPSFTRNTGGNRPKMFVYQNYAGFSLKFSKNLQMEYLHRYRSTLDNGWYEPPSNAVFLKLELSF